MSGGSSLGSLERPVPSTSMLRCTETHHVVLVQLCPGTFNLHGCGHRHRIGGCGGRSQHAELRAPTVPVAFARCVGLRSALLATCPLATATVMSGCCVDYGQQDLLTPPDPDTGVGRDTAAQEDHCDGLDDDGDGLVDEGYPDLDGDGHADCVDEDCELASLAAEPIFDVPACAATLLPAAAPWSVEIMWESESSYGGCARETVIADLDGDGISDVVCDGLQTS